jgi:hypothetical protein
MVELSATEQQCFADDGFLIVDKLIDVDKLPVRRQAFADLCSGQFETGVRPDAARRWLPNAATRRFSGAGQ